ncbi:sigma-70 family RNA polymerase sigma factor [Nocardia sp. NPDC051030]|uniref:sigma-70 family RNA polymerase sigma factor n=1 Tax=Nocardia sp. NPDC051030 TaxID=3155162 RepID=UPI00342DD1C0
MQPIPLPLSPRHRLSPEEELTELALAAGRGDRVALERFIRETQHDVWRFVAHLTDVQSADDLTQETFLRALRSVPSFAGRSSARTWLLSIARRVVVDRIRSASARPKKAHMEWQSAIDEHHERDCSDFPEELAIADLLRSLPEDRREAFVLTRVFGLSYGEAADAIGCPIGTIRSRVARARDALMLLMSEPDQSLLAGQRAS